MRFLSGTDDNALKNVIATEAAGVPVANYVAARADEFEALGRTLGLSLNDYIRTSTDRRHLPGVERLWQATAASDDRYGNLVNRITTLAEKHRPDRVPPAPASDPLLDLASEARDNVNEALARFDIRAAAATIESLVRAANTYIQQHRPWELARQASPESAKNFDRSAFA